MVTEWEVFAEGPLRFVMARSREDRPTDRPTDLKILPGPVEEKGFLVVLVREDALHRGVHQHLDQQIPRSFNHL